MRNNFHSNSSYRESKLYIPTNQMINDVIHYIKKINPLLQFNINLLIHPDYGNENRDILDTLNNPHLKIHYMSQDNQKYVITAGDLCIHWHWNKIYDNLKYNNTAVLPHDFNPTFYKKIYNDLRNMSDKESEEHYINYGIKEDRVYKIDNDILFNPDIYRKIYKDLSHMNDEEAKLHYISYGIKEDRKYKYEDIFDATKYKNLHPDLKNMSDREVTQHFYQYGINEGRNIF
jgi:hypothetical protein